LGHDTQYILPASFTHTPKYLPVGCWFQLQESAAASAKGTEAAKTPKKKTKPLKILRMDFGFKLSA
jgi:hypothetical protein